MNYRSAGVQELIGLTWRILSWSWIIIKMESNLRSRFGAGLEIGRCSPVFCIRLSGPKVGGRRSHLVRRKLEATVNQTT